MVGIYTYSYWHRGFTWCATYELNYTMCGISTKIYCDGFYKLDPPSVHSIVDKNNAGDIVDLIPNALN